MMRGPDDAFFSKRPVRPNARRLKPASPIAAFSRPVYRRV